MKLTFTSGALLLLCCMFGSSAIAQSDYRTVASGNWTTLSIWETFNEGLDIWEAATVVPSYTDGVITIRNVDDVFLSSPLTIDQVVVDAGASLTINSGGSAIPITLNNGTGDDLIVNGQLSVLGDKTTLSGAGTVHINNGGTFLLGGLGILGAPLTSDGHIIFGSTVAPTGGGFIEGTTLTNNNTAEWVTTGTGHIVLRGGSTFINNGTITVSSTLNPLYLYSNSPNATLNQFTNNGTLIKNTGGLLEIRPNVNNTGEIAVTGTLALIGTTIANTGTIAIAPDAVSRTLTVPASLINAKTCTVEIEITGSTATAGTDYDQLTISGTTDLSNVTLSIIDDNSSTPVGTVYTVMTGDFSGVPTLNSTNFGNLTVNSNSVTVEKLAILPVKWGNDLTPLAKGNKVQLSWSTLQEENTSHFIVEYSTDGSHFTSIGQVAAQGNSTTTSPYVFWHNTPDLNRINIYRVKQVDLDGKATYSATRSIKFTNGKVNVVTSVPNPVKSEMVITVQERNLTLILNNLNGTEVRRWRLEPGTYPMNLQDLRSGIYLLNVYDKNKKIDTQKVIKL